MKKNMAALLGLMLVFGGTPALAKQSLLVGKRAALQSENLSANRLKLSRLVDDKELKRFKKRELLVKLPKGKTLKVDHRLPGKYRYVRPATRQFLTELSERFYARFGKKLCVTSAARTVEYQRELIRHNGNAARGNSPLTRSSHLTGATIDITKKDLTIQQIAWLRERLILNERVGRALVTEEFRQSVFHIMVLY